MPRKPTLSNAERQARFREKRKADSYQLNTPISSDAYHALQRLASHYGLTAKDLLETLIKREEIDVVARIRKDGTPDALGWYQDRAARRPHQENTLIDGWKAPGAITAENVTE